MFIPILIPTFWFMRMPIFEFAFIMLAFAALDDARLIPELVLVLLDVLTGLGADCIHAGSCCCSCGCGC